MRIRGAQKISRERNLVCLLLLFSAALRFSFFVTQRTCWGKEFYVFMLFLFLFLYYSSSLLRKLIGGRSIVLLCLFFCYSFYFSALLLSLMVHLTSPLTWYLIPSLPVRWPGVYTYPVGLDSAPHVHLARPLPSRRHRTAESVCVGVCTCSERVQALYAIRWPWQVIRESSGKSSSSYTWQRDLMWPTFPRVLTCDWGGAYTITACLVLVVVVVLTFFDLFQC